MKQKPLPLVILFLGCIFVSGCGVPAAQVPGNPAAAIAITTIMPVADSTSVPTTPPAALPTATSTPAPPPGAIQVSARDGMPMVYIPAGLFDMGSFIGTVDEQPMHSVSLDAYWMDKTEVTNRMYSRCVQSGSCLALQDQSNTHPAYYSDPQFADFPVIAVDWHRADVYCAWAGRRLSTEAEWEKAALGIDGRNFPWGDTLPNDSRLNFNNSIGDTVRVGSYQSGASPYGLLDMAGNVNEWVADWYDPGYYAISPSANPTGPLEGAQRVLRGGSWHTDEYNIRSADRHYLPPDAFNIVIGFRCALSAP